MGHRVCRSWVASLAVLLVLPIGATAKAYHRPVTPRVDRFEEVGPKIRLAKIVRLVEESNAPNLVGEARWRSCLAEHRTAIEQTQTHDDFARAVNELLKSTGISHFAYYGDHEWTHWFLRGTFLSGSSDVGVEHVGLYPQQIDGRWFVRGVLEGSPVASTIVAVGDEPLSVDGRPYSPITSFRGKAGRPTCIRLQRSPGLIYNVLVTPVHDSLFQAAQQATRESIRVIEYAGCAMAYMHAWTLLGGGGEYEQLLALQDGVDGLLLDYRDGFGGTWEAAARFLLGRRSTPDGPRREPDWSKPVVILTADGTRSAKEIVVDEVKRTGRAPLVGEPTPGFVTTVGGVRPVGEDGLLMLPGYRFSLEGRPTEPDYRVTRDIRYGAGFDPQLGLAKKVLAALIHQARLQGAASGTDAFRAAA